MSKNARCTAITKAGKPCQAMGAKGGTLCLFHSRCDAESHGGRQPLTVEKMIRILEIQLRRVRNIEDVAEQARETRAIINQIVTLKNNNVGSGNNDNAGGPIEDRVNKWKKNQT